MLLQCIYQIGILSAFTVVRATVEVLKQPQGLQIIAIGKVEFKIAKKIKKQAYAPVPIMASPF